MLRNPARVAVTPVASTVERIDQRIIRVDRGAKPIVLVDVLRHETIDRALIFTRTKHGADKVARSLIKAGIAAGTLHGNKSQGHRERVLGFLSQRRCQDFGSYGHSGPRSRCGRHQPRREFRSTERPGNLRAPHRRTARAGADGIAISLCDVEEAGLLHDIEKLIRKSIPATDRRTQPRSAAGASLAKSSGAEVDAFLGQSATAALPRRPGAF